MKLHKKSLARSISQRIAPIVSNLIQWLNLTNFVRKCIALLNYCIGRGAGTGWNIITEVKGAVSCIKRDTPVVFDVGGNVGEWSKVYRGEVSEGDLFIFEPQVFCQKQIREKNIPKSELICAAVGAEKAKMDLYSSSPTDPTASLHERNETFFEESTYVKVEVDVICLDDFIEERKIDFIDYIKFDIEGHELAAIEGMEKALAARKVGAFSFEFGGGNLNSRTFFKDFWNKLHNEYTFYLITPSGKLSEVDSYYEDMEYFRGVSNYIAKLKPKA